MSSPTAETGAQLGPGPEMIGVTRIAHLPSAPIHGQLVRVPAMIGVVKMSMVTV